MKQVAHEESYNDFDIKKLTYVLHALVNAYKKDHVILTDLVARLERIETKIDVVPKVVGFGLAIASAIVSITMWIMQHYGK